MARSSRKKIILYQLYCFILLTSYFAYPQAPSIQFKHLGLDQGLSQSSVNCIAQDSVGFMWFGTQDGLNMYDGYSFTVYKHIPEDETSISDNTITALYADKAGILWIGTDAGGLEKFDTKTAKFTLYKHHENEKGSLSSNHISSITGDNRDNIWIGTRSGVDQLNISSGNIVHYKHIKGHSNSLRSDTVYAVFTDKLGRIWIGTRRGLDILEPKTRTFKHVSINSSRLNSASSNIVICLTEDKSGRMWIGTWGGGLYELNGRGEIVRHYIRNNSSDGISSDSISAVVPDDKGFIFIGTSVSGLDKLDPATGNVIHYSHDLTDPNSLADQQILSLAKDREGLIWIGTTISGVDKLDEKENRFHTYRAKPGSKFSIDDDDIVSFGEDTKSNIWVGTYSGGLNKIEPGGRIISYMKNSSPNSLSNNSVTAILADGPDKLWVGTLLGLNLFEEKKGIFVHYTHDQANSNSLSNNNINTLVKDASGNLWIGLMSDGLDKMDTDGNFTHFIHVPGNRNTIAGNNINTLYVDKEGRIWIGTYNSGLDCYDPASKIFKHFNHDSAKRNSLSQNMVLSIFQFPHRDDGYLWIGTGGGGLNRLNLKTGEFTFYTEEDGLANNQVYGILGDKNGRLWMSTNKGISRFNPATGKFKNFNEDDGLQSNEFNQNAYFEDSRGRMFFGGVKGFNMLYPDSISDNRLKPRVVFTSFKIFNKEVKLSRPVSSASELELSYKDYVISFSFSALSYTDPARNLYAYKLKGFDDKWIELGHNNSVTLTNLDPGEYTLIIKGSNEDEIWNKAGASINLIITPPYWETWWFRIIVASVMLFLAFLIFKYRVRTIENRNKKLELVVSERTHELKVKTEELEKVNSKQSELVRLLSDSEKQLRKMNESKDEFFSILAHDLRSPFNGILGFSEILANEIETLEPDLIRQSAGNINKSAKNLFKLLNNLLEWSKVQIGKIEIKASGQDISQIVAEVIHLMSANAQRKNINLISSINPDMYVWTDRTMTESILQNLIANAVKFTHEGGNVHISAEDNDSHIKISVKDDGVGIKAEDLRKIFDPHTHFTSSGTANEKGSGIGLKLCRDLVEKLGGKIWVESSLGEWTKFTFTLPKPGIIENPGVESAPAGSTDI